MKLAIMQPYLFPYVGYYGLIDYSDKFIFFDTPQYIQKGWINRNRIIGNDGQPVYFTIPVKKAPRDTKIEDMVVNETTNWRDKILGQLSVYKRKAPYYDNVMSLVKSVISFKPEARTLSQCCIDSIVKTCQYIGMDIEYDVFSDMNLFYDNIDAPDEWALEISKSLGAKTYVNPPGGKTFFDSQKYADAGIELLFLEPDFVRYIQKIGHFEAGLSILDVMMFNSPNETKDIIKSYKIVRS